MGADPRGLFGLFGPRSLCHAAVRLKRWWLWAVTAVYGVGSVALFVIAGSPEGGWGDAVLGPLTVGFPRAPAGPAAAAVLAGGMREEASAVAAGDVAPAGRAAGTRENRPGRPSPQDGTGVPAGWYPDPAGGPRRRYWDGRQWAGRMTEPATSSFSRWAAGASLALFVAACALPALLLKVIPDTPQPSPPSTETWPGLVLLMYGPLGMLAGQFGWLANPAFVGAVIALLWQRWRTAVVAGAAGFLIAFDTLLLARYPVLNGDTDSDLGLEQLLPGFYVWLASFVVVVAGGLLGLRRQSRTAAAGSGAAAIPGPAGGPKPPQPAGD